MFGGPLFGPDVRPPQPGQPQQQPQADSGGFEQALNDLIDFLGMGGTEQALENQIAAEDEGRLSAEPLPPREAPYEPTESANLIDRREGRPDIDSAVRRWGGSVTGGEPDPKRAAARLSLMPRGVIPFVSAAYDTATGQAEDGLSLGSLYRKRQAEADMLLQDQRPAADTVGQYLPYAIGPAIGAFARSTKGATAVENAMRTGGRGMVGGAIMGGLEGYFDPRFDSKPLDDRERIMAAAKMGGLGSVMAGGLATGTHAGIDMAKGAMRGPRVAASSAPPSQPQPSAPPAPPRATGSRLSRPTGTELHDRAFEKRYQRDLGSVAKSLGMDKDELAKRVEASRAADIGGRASALTKPAPEAPKGLNQAVATPEAPKVEAPKVEAPQPKQRSAARPTKRGKEIAAEIKEKTRLAQVRSDAIVMGNERRPIAEMTGVKANVRIVPDSQPGEVRFSAPRNRGSYAPKEKKGVMELSEGVTAKVGRQPSQWTREDKEAFISQAARHTNLSPAKIKSLLTSYGEGSARAKRGIGNARIREIVEAERMKARTEK